MEYEMWFAIDDIQNIKYKIWVAEKMISWASKGYAQDKSCLNRNFHLLVIVRGV